MTVTLAEEFHHQVATIILVARIQNLPTGDLPLKLGRRDQSDQMAAVVQQLEVFLELHEMVDTTRPEGKLYQTLFIQRKLYSSLLFFCSSSHRTPTPRFDPKPQQPQQQQQPEEENWDDDEEAPPATLSPRSARGTPHTNTSPRSMQTGDSTPLYDEN